MKKKISLLIMTMLVNMPVLAATASGAPVKTEGIDCGIFVDITKPIAKMLMIAAPILLLVFGTIDFTGAVAASDEKAMKKAVSNFIKRLIVCVVILILPVLINTLMGWIKFDDLTACW